MLEDPILLFSTVFEGLSDTVRASTEEQEHYKI